MIWNTSVIVLVEMRARARFGLSVYAKFCPPRLVVCWYDCITGRSYANTDVVSFSLNLSAFWEERWRAESRAAEKFFTY